MKTGNRWAWPAWAIVAVFGVVLATGIFVPVYADEAAGVLMRGMFLANDWRLNTLMPQCGPGFLQSVQWLHLPGALVSDLIMHAGTPLGVRVRGLAIGFAWLLATWMVFRALIRSDVLRIWLFAGFVAVLGVGVLPLTLVMMRGEQMMLFLLSVLLVLPLVLRRDRAAGHQGTTAGLAAAFCLVTSLFFYTHPKAVFFIPLVLLSAVATFGPRSRYWTAIVTTVVLGAAWQTLKFAAQVSSCPGAPQMSAILAGNTVSLGGAWAAPGAFVQTLIANVQAAPEAMLRHIVFADNYQSAWLASVPGLEQWQPAASINACIGYVVRGTYWAALLFPPVLIVVQAIRRAPAGAVWWMAAFWLALVGHAALFKTWNFYAASLLLPIALWCLVFAIATLLDRWRAADTARTGHVVAAVLSPVLVLFLASAAVLVLRALPATIESSRSAGFGLPRQGLSIPTLDYAKQRPGIRAFARQCNIQGDGARHLVVDNLTYFAFHDLREPLQSDYLYEQGFGVDLKGDALPALLKRLGAPGIIAQCTMFPTVFAPRMRREGNLCCVDLSNGQ